MNIVEYRQELGWSRIDLMRESGLSDKTIMKAERGEAVTGRTARALAKAISNGMGKPLTFHQIEGLQVKIQKPRTPQRRRSAANE